MCIRACAMEVRRMPEIIERHLNAVADYEKKLEMSREGVDVAQLRAIRCPHCGFYLLDVYGHDHYYVRVKCRKCKFDELIDTALFRTLRSRSRFSWLRKRRKMTGL